MVNSLSRHPDGRERLPAGRKHESGRIPRSDPLHKLEFCGL